MILFASLSLVAAGACGDNADNAGDDSSESAGGQLTEEEFIEEGDKICRDLGTATGEVEPPAEEADFARYLTEVRGEAEAARETWELLEPPDDGEEIHQSMLDQLSKAIETVNGAITAAEAGDTVTAGDLLREADDAGDALDSELQAYGFEQCGRANTAEEGGEEGGSSEEAPQDEPLPEESDPAPVDEQPAEDQPGDPEPSEG